MATPELPTNVYRLDPKTGRATVAAGDVNRPNGLAFSPDEKKLYIVEAGVAPRVIRVYDVDGEKLANARTFITAEAGGTPDGFRCDVDGNLWCGWGMGNAQQDGVKIFDATGKPIGFIALPERCANVCFGGVKRNRLFMTASHSVYSLYVNTQGAPRRLSRRIELEPERKSMSVERKEVGPRMSQIVIHGDTVYLAGTVAHANAGKSVTEQTKEILATIDSHLAQAGTDKSKLLSANIWLSDMATFAEMNAVWDAWVVPGHTPARATVEAKLAAPQYKVEIMVVAAR